jgi:hypothetical protein
MTRAEIENLSIQADKAAAKVSSWPLWQQDLAEQAVQQAGTDAEPEVHSLVLQRVQLALTGEHTGPPIASPGRDASVRSVRPTVANEEGEPPVEAFPRHDKSSDFRPVES